MQSAGSSLLRSNDVDICAIIIIIGQTVAVAWAATCTNEFSIQVCRHQTKQSHRAHRRSNDNDNGNVE